MTDSKELLAQELKVYYPDVTDAELYEMTDKLINFFAIGAKAIYETEHQPEETRLNDFKDK